MIGGEMNPQMLGRLTQMMGHVPGPLPTANQKYWVQSLESGRGKSHTKNTKLTKAAGRSVAILRGTRLRSPLDRNIPEALTWRWVAR